MGITSLCGTSVGVAVALEADEEGADILNSTQLLFGICNGVVFQPQEIGELLIVQIGHALVNIVVQENAEDLEAAFTKAAGLTS